MSLTHHSKALLALLCLPGLGPCAQAQETRQAAPPAAPAYQDRLITGLTSTDAPEAAYDASGLPLYLRLDAGMVRNPQTGNAIKSGASALAWMETPNHGTLSLNLSAATTLGHDALTLRQRGLPVDGGWLGNNALGVVTTPATSLLRVPGRIAVPTHVVEGASTEWSNAARGLQWQSSMGTPGRLDGLPSSGFVPYSGRVATAGVEVDGAGTQAALALAHADRYALTDSVFFGTAPVTQQSAQLALRRQDADRQWLANVLSTHDSTAGRTRNAVWLDNSGPERGAAPLSWGAYWLDPSLSWAGLPMASDAAGAYVRKSWNARQWNASTSLDWLRSVSNPSEQGAFATTNARWRHDRRWSFGAGGSVRRFNGRAWSAFADTQWDSGWGHSSLRVDTVLNTDSSQAQAFTLNQDWTMATGASFSTNVGLGQELHGTQRLTRTLGAIALSQPVGNSLLLRGNLSGSRASTGDNQYAVNLGLNWRLDQHWSVDGAWFASHGKTLPLASIDPLAAPVLLEPLRTDYRSVQVLLRYEFQSGSRQIPLGGRAQQGGGSIQGTVYLDASRNGRQEANEQGASGVTVYLDSRYAVRTDALGRYEFPFVAAGPHQVRVATETLPLPWAPSADARAEVEVRLRETARLDLGVLRQNGE